MAIQKTTMHNLKKEIIFSKKRTTLVYSVLRDFGVWWQDKLAHSHHLRINHISFIRRRADKICIHLNRK